MVGDTDPPKCSVYRPVSQVCSRTSPIGAKREFSAAPAPLALTLETKTPTTAATEAGANDVWVILEDQAGSYVNRAPEARGMRA